MRIEELQIDNDYKSCLPDLSTDEYTNLEKNIIKHGVISPIVIWNKTIIDGHNRYSICKAHSIQEVPVKEMTFDSKDSALEWILGNQLSRRNLTDYQKNVIALKYKEVIAAKMKERQIASGGDKVSAKAKSGVGQKTITAPEKTTTRRELAKIAGTNETSIRRTELILKEGTEDQKERAMKGGKGNSVSAIAKEIKEQNEPVGVCGRCGAVKPISQMYDFHKNGIYVCRDCENERHHKTREAMKDFEKTNKIVKRIKSGESEPYDRKAVLREMKYAADGLVSSWKAIIEEHKDIVLKDETIVENAICYLQEKFKEETINVTF